MHSAGIQDMVVITLMGLVTSGNVAAMGRMVSSECRVRQSDFQTLSADWHHFLYVMIHFVTSSVSFEVLYMLQNSS